MDFKLRERRLFGSGNSESVVEHTMHYIRMESVQNTISPPNTARHRGPHAPQPPPIALQTARGLTRASLDRQRAIQDANFRLADTMVGIGKRKLDVKALASPAGIPSVGDLKDPAPTIKPSNVMTRLREGRRIDRENIKLLQRLFDAKPVIRTHSLEKDAERSREIVARMARNKHGNIMKMKKQKGMQEDSEEEEKPKLSTRQRKALQKKEHAAKEGGWQKVYSWDVAAQQRIVDERERQPIEPTLDWYYTTKSGKLKKKKRLDKRRVIAEMLANAEAEQRAEEEDRIQRRREKRGNRLTGQSKPLPQLPAPPEHGVEQQQAAGQQTNDDRSGLTRPRPHPFSPAKIRAASPPNPQHHLYNFPRPPRTSLPFRQLATPSGAAGVRAREEAMESVAASSIWDAEKGTPRKVQGLSPAVKSGLYSSTRKVGSDEHHETETSDDEFLQTAPADMRPLGTSAEKQDATDTTSQQQQQQQHDDKTAQNQTTIESSYPPASTGPSGEAGQDGAEGQGGTESSNPPPRTATPPADHTGEQQEQPQEPESQVVDPDLEHKP